MSEEVKWQAAFWGLVPIAINTMTQPSGKVLGFPSSDGFFLRSSPFVCACDTLYIIAALIHQGIGHGSVRVAARVIIENRFSDAANESESESFSQFRRNTVVRLVLFVLSTLLGIVKIYGMQGVPWTKAWASMFLSSFLILEIVGLLAGKGSYCWTGARVPQQPVQPADSARPFPSGTPHQASQSQPCTQDPQIGDAKWHITGVIVAPSTILINLVPIYHAIGDQWAKSLRQDPNVDYIAHFLYSIFACFLCLFAPHLGMVKQYGFLV